MESIEITPAKLRQQIKEINAAVAALEKVKNETISSVQMNFENAGKGAAMDAFKKKIRILSQKLDEEISTLKRISKALINVLVNFEEAERIGKTKFGGSGR